MVRIPDIVFIIGQKRELIAVKECIKLKVILISLLDTNCNPELTDFIIPANDDSITSVSLLLDEIVLSINS